MLLFVTNNDEIQKRFNEMLTVIYLEGASYVDVMLEVRDLIHRGYTLVSHPLCGSIKPNQTPYRTVLLSDKSDRTAFYKSCQTIETTLEAAQKFIRDKATPSWSEKSRADFRTVDLSFFEILVKRCRLNDALL